MSLKDQQSPDGPQNPGKQRTNQQAAGNPALRKNEDTQDQAEGARDRGETQGGQGNGAGLGRHRF